MKKIVSIIIILSILLFSYVIHVSASDSATPIESSDIESQVMSEAEKAFDELSLKYQQEYGYEFNDEYFIAIWDYYCHFYDESTIDYVYVQWHTNGGSDAVVGDRFLNYCIKASQISRPTIGLYIYEVKSKKIYTFEQAESQAEFYLRDFLDNHKNELSPHYQVYKSGDMNFDDAITVLDATLIQRAVAKTDDYSQYDLFTDVYYTGVSKIYFISDINYDGKRDILDATAIQRQLAKLE
ncbi:MAG: dockerin type I repeat-containing protein [Ruminococcus sp.]|nr:dockerin type I repeat-containing protein [Ruminococcus sp.]